MTIKRRNLISRNADRRQVTVALSTALLTLFTPLSGTVLAGADAAPTFQGFRRTFVEMRPRPSAPVTPLITETGGVTNIARMDGRVVFIYFWATWCPTCLYELPELDRLQADHSEDDLRVIAVSGQAVEFDYMRAYFTRLGVSRLALFRDPDRVGASALGANNNVPYSFIIDRNGRVAGYMAGGADWGSSEGRRLIRYFIDG